MKKNNIKTKVIGTVMAALCVVSAGAAISSVGVSAATAPAAVSATAKAPKNCVFFAYGKTARGYDWDYTAVHLPRHWSVCRSYQRDFEVSDHRQQVAQHSRALCDRQGT